MPVTQANKPAVRPRPGSDLPQTMTAEEYVALPKRLHGYTATAMNWCGTYWSCAIRDHVGSMGPYKASCNAISTNGWKNSDTAPWP